MNKAQVLVTTIKNVRTHPNAERLEIYTVFGWDVIGQLNQYKVGQEVIYIPVDSVLSPDTEAKLFGAEAKIKLTKGRVRQIRLRKLPSQGLLAPIELLVKPHPVGTNVADLLEITKYEPPSAKHLVGAATPRVKPLENPHFHKYKGVENLKWDLDVFQGKEVVVEGKIHGTSARAGLQPTVANTKWKKLLKFFKMLPEYEFCTGSNNVELTNRNNRKGFYSEDVYGAAFKACNAFLKVLPGETIYGEVVFEGCQKGYHYGHKTPHFILFDVRVTLKDGTQEFLNPESVEGYAKLRGFDFVPVLYVGLYDKAIVDSFVSGADPYYPLHAVREGIVIKARTEYSGGPNGKKAYKYINPDYLDNKDNSDFN